MRIIDIAFHGVGRIDAGVLETTLRTPGTLTVPVSAPALDVVDRATRSRARVIMVVDEHQHPQGLVVPAALRKALRTFRPETFSGNVVVDLEAMTHDPAEIQRNFRHEWLNATLPTLYVCKPHNHLVDRCPCTVDGHEGSTCEELE